MKTKLIILRGPSGSGKSTVAKRLQRETGRNVAIVEQDYYREVMFYPKATSSEVRHMMIYENARIALDAGFDVIMDGIFASQDFGEYFEKLFKDHTGGNYGFFFDVSLKETKKRHGERGKSKEFSADYMGKWYEASMATRYDWEKVIPESYSLDQSIEFIRKNSGI